MFSNVFLSSLLVRKKSASASMSLTAHQARNHLQFLRVTQSIKFAGTLLYTWVERGTVRVKHLAQEHKTMSLARVQGECSSTKSFD